jgi:hypothetical protein
LRGASLNAFPCGLLKARAGLGKETAGSGAPLPSPLDRNA